jgi:hypothetical protein
VRPGAGKTYVLNQFIAHARAEGANVAVTASTGIASTHINGQTIHSWSGVGVSTALTQNLLKQIRSRRKRKIEATDILIIDEVSMLHAWLFRHGRSGLPGAAPQPRTLRRLADRALRRFLPAAASEPIGQEQRPDYAQPGIPRSSGALHASRTKPRRLHHRIAGLG